MRRDSWRPPLGPTTEEQRIFRSLGRYSEDPMNITFEELHVEPEKPRVGRVAYADGTDWNPGSGEGLYVYKSGGWTFIA